jgi:hypothetical protein
MIPQGTINERAAMREVGQGLRYLPYSKDAMMGDDFKPVVIQPFNAGDVPGKVAQFAKTIADGLSPVQDLIAEKGRVDSASGLQFLDEQISKAMTNPTSGVQVAFGTMYRAVVAKAAGQMLVSKRALPVNKLTTELAGAVINPETGTRVVRAEPAPELLADQLYGHGHRSQERGCKEAGGHEHAPGRPDGPGWPEVVCDEGRP